jgi:hypothetical protein
MTYGNNWINGRDLLIPVITELWFEYVLFELVVLDSLVSKTPFDNFFVSPLSGVSNV